MRRSVLVSDQPALVRMAAGLDFLLAYPYGCTEQRLSRARAELALTRLRDLLHTSGDDERLRKDVADTLEWLGRAVGPEGLVAYWPGSGGYVSLTAWSLDFLVEAKAAGYAVDEKLWNTLSRSLEQSLRTDYGHFIDGESFAERSWALAALTAAGKAQPAYAAELARKAQFLDLEGVSEVLQAFAKSSGPEAAPAADNLVRRLWGGVVLRLHGGRTRAGQRPHPAQRDADGGRDDPRPGAPRRRRPAPGDADRGPDHARRRRRLGLDQRQRRGAAGAVRAAQAAVCRQPAAHRRGASRQEREDPGDRPQGAGRGVRLDGGGGRSGGRGDPRSDNGGGRAGQRRGGWGRGCERGGGRGAGGCRRAAGRGARRDQLPAGHRRRPGGPRGGGLRGQPRAAGGARREAAARAPAAGGARDHGPFLGRRRSGITWRWRCRSPPAWSR